MSTTIDDKFQSDYGTIIVYIFLMDKKARQGYYGPTYYTNLVLQVRRFYSKIYTGCP